MGKKLRGTLKMMRVCLAGLLAVALVFGMGALFPLRVQAANTVQLGNVDDAPGGQYIDWDAAVAAAGTGGTIVLTADFTCADKSYSSVTGLVLDLGSYNFTCLNKVNFNNDSIIVQGSGTMTLLEGLALTDSEFHIANGSNAKVNVQSTKVHETAVLAVRSNVTITSAVGVNFDGARAQDGSHVIVRGATVGLYVAAGASDANSYLWAKSATATLVGSGMYASNAVLAAYGGKVEIEGDAIASSATGGKGAYATTGGQITVGGKAYGRGIGALAEDAGSIIKVGSAVGDMTMGRRRRTAAKLRLRAMPLAIMQVCVPNTAEVI